ncbi:MAG: TetR/AcrR family transcriptional regulator [Caulobacterales bacterium]
MSTQSVNVTPREPDGRRRRSVDSRARIVAAMLELVHAGEVAPGAEQVAVLAQVGLRTVFRHFKDMDSLYGEMAAVMVAELEEVARRPFRGSTWRDRVVELVERRAGAFEKIAPFKRAADVHRHHSRLLQANHDRLVTTAREILKRELPPEVARDPVKLELLDLLLSYEAWSRLRREQGLTPRGARNVLEAAVLRTLEG